VIDQLRDKKAIIFYAADHGESINEKEHLHGTPRKMAPPEQFRVPMSTTPMATDLPAALAYERCSNPRRQTRMPCSSHSLPSTGCTTMRKTVWILTAQAWPATRQNTVLKQKSACKRK
jgi:glucan phosphoethanolaminetransferase (alkaline phosphatase superfamily)